MRLISIRELKSKTAEVLSRLSDDEIVLTSNGRPTAVIAHVGEGDVEAMLREIRLARMRILVDRLRKQAAAAGSSELDQAQIVAEIAAVRAEARR